MHGESRLKNLLKAGFIGEIFKQEKSALVSEPKSFDSLANNLLHALQNPD